MVQPEDDKADERCDQIGRKIGDETNEQYGHCSVSRYATSGQGAGHQNRTADTAAGHHLIGEQFGDAERDDKRQRSRMARVAQGPRPRQRCTDIGCCLGCEGQQEPCRLQCHNEPRELFQSTEVRDDQHDRCQCHEP